MPRAGQTTKALVKLPRAPEGCWTWRGAMGTKYPIKEYCGETMTAQRWMWMTLFGPLDGRIFVGNTCGRHDCVNPQHLRARDIADVNREARSGLVPADVVEIREAYDNGVSCETLARKFDIDPSTVSRIGNRRIWKNKLPKGAKPKPGAVVSM